MLSAPLIEHTQALAVKAHKRIPVQVQSTALNSACLQGKSKKIGPIMAMTTHSLFLQHFSRIS
ncbi:hypothetical protein FOCG_15022 [Fusarium oxysporum f. sp. radicis-lycopersici 26381]|uniref:Uncharacterized protein n=1 Tax=Fusarium oxysporum Fo47 TaxID=660027 RepID=W9JT99_FUSOX|nr:hypothetical protein FOZG_13433 [Fusarium oxysporum Fo47]EWZ83225.1 hypothetical protein FOWG_13150 [Fusarium oxysporum f. sp. lycopersici MN25]EXL42565.1 hypothetical protein FOCG_15022 [Fusarium oxysporum f. sp. radicis-lycopersici 26381]